ncbi:hypothetical protein D9758_013816 [Tetrapyrgos nigripes]|uniref:DUF6987 domain-containing protein n=1 Tax=Tetrapyrgos nigripes TaxID=182062 RepID=A0A8H5FT70_9AGAR|nr:hypothetical protein D9758_013816 [Tetrapyrgos nigripes]
MMIFSKAICLLSIFSIAASKPISTSQARSNDVALVENRRAELNITVGSVLNTLQDQVNTILPQIQNLDNANAKTLSPLIGDLTEALDNAADDLSRIHASGKVDDKAKRQSNDNTANLIATIVRDITFTLDSVVVTANQLPVVGPLFNRVDKSLNRVLFGVGSLVQGVLKLVANLLFNVTGILGSLGLGLTLGALGL